MEDKGILTLRHPIMIDGKSVRELKYDIEKITPEHFILADTKKSIARDGKNIKISPTPEFDFSLMVYLGFYAIIAENDGIDISDLERIQGTDIMEVLKIGRNFILTPPDLQEENSEEESETTPESSTPPLKK